MIKIFKFFKLKEWLFVIISVGFIVFQVFLDLRLPDYMQEITLLVKTPGSSMDDILIAGGWMILCALLSLVASVIVGILAANVAATLAKKVRLAIFEKVESFSLEEINYFSTASLITRSTNDITQIQQIVAMGMQLMIKAPILAVWAMSKIAGKSWQWSVATAGAIGCLLLLVIVVFLFVLPRFRKIQILTDNLNQVTRENLTGLRVVRAYNASKYQADKFEKANAELTDNNLITNRIVATFMPSMNLIMSGLTLSIYWIGAHLINQAQQIPDKFELFADMVIFSAYAMQVVMSFIMLTMIFIMLPRAQVAAKRVFEVLNTKASIIDGHIDEINNGIVGEVEFKNVSFKYPDAAEYVLENISFKAEKGQVVAFIGSTGSGKSTLINLIPRFYDATEGEILVNGVNVKDYKQKTLRDKLGYVAQKAVLFSGTINSNVTYGEKANNENNYQKLEQAIAKAVEIAQAKDFVEAMEDGYESNVSQGGTNLSGGQKQRIAIARAVFSQPEIYIFDDSFSALDYKTDRILRRVLKKETANITSLIVAQRIGTIKDADQIIVLDEGKMVGIGTHQELLEQCAVYQQIAYSQLSKEELAHGTN